MSLSITGVHHVSILSTNFDRSRQFYTGILGFEEIAKPSTFNFNVCWFRFGDEQLHLIDADKADTISPRHFAVHVEDAKAARVHLKENDCAVEETTPIPGADRFFTHDPDGNRIEMIQWFEDYGTGR